MNNLLEDDQFCSEATRLMYEYIEAMDKCDIGIASNKYSFEYYYGAMKEKEKEVFSFLKDNRVREDVINLIIGEAVGNRPVLMGIYHSFSPTEKDLFRFLDVENVNQRYEKEKRDKFIADNSWDLIGLLKKYVYRLKEMNDHCSGTLKDEQLWRNLIEAKDDAFAKMKVLGFNNPTIRDIFEGLGGSYDYNEYEEDSEAASDKDIVKTFLKAAKKK